MTFAESFWGFGNRPTLTPRHQVEGETGTIGDKGGSLLGSPMICFKRYKKSVFHEVRGLAATLLKDAGNTNTQISNVMAHESINTTLDYMNPDDLPFEDVTIHI